VCAMKVFNVQDGLGSADFNEYAVNTKYVEKAAPTTRVSTTTLTADPDLQLHLDANKTYRMELVAPFTSATAAGFKISFFVPAGTVFTGYTLTTIANLVSIFVYSSANLLITANIPMANTQGSGIDDLVAVSGIIDTAGTAGNIGYQWCQNTSNAGNTTVRAGSSMLIRRVS
jgi:hypothetical protein